MAAAQLTSFRRGDEADRASATSVPFYRHQFTVFIVFPRLISALYMRVYDDTDNCQLTFTSQPTDFDRLTAPYT